MLKTIFTNALLSVSLIAALSSTNIVLAGEHATQHHKHNVVDRKTEKVKTDKGFTRTVSKTDDKGATASHRTDVVLNKDEGTRSKTVSGTTFEGKTYSGQSTAHKTETGYVSQGQMTNPDGKVINRSVNANIDRSAGTVTKDISVTPQGGETTTRTVVRPLKEHKSI